MPRYSTGLLASGRSVYRPRPIQPGVVFTNPREVDKSDEGKAVKIVSRLFGNMAFDPSRFAYAFSRVPLPLQMAFVDVVCHYYSILAEKYDRNLFMDTDEQEFLRIGKDIDRYLNA